MCAPHCGARNEPTLNVAAGLPITCADCGKEFHAPGAEALAFNSAGACPACSGTGIVRKVNRAALVPDESKSIDDGAVLPWGSLMWNLMKQVCGAMGVRTNVPFSELTPEERDIVFNGPAVKKHILYKPKKGDDFAELDFTYFNAVYTVENALAKAKDEKGLKRVARFLKEGPCADCGGTRLSAAARTPHVRGLNLAEASAMTLDVAVDWVHGVPESLPADMRPMATNICESFLDVARQLLDLGLGYLALDRAGCHTFHRRTPACAARPGRAQPHHRRAVCARRAIHRPASLERGRAARSDARFGGGRQFRGGRGP